MVCPCTISESKVPDGVAALHGTSIPRVAHLVGRAQGDGLGPLPVGVHVKEAVQQGRRGSPGVQLTDVPGQGDSSARQVSTEGEYKRRTRTVPSRIPTARRLHRLTQIALVCDSQRRLHKWAWPSTHRRERCGGHVRSENVAVDATQVAHLVGVDASTLGPVTDGSKAQDEAIETAAVKNAPSTKVFVARLLSTPTFGSFTTQALRNQAQVRSHNAQTTAIQRALSAFRTVMYGGLRGIPSSEATSPTTNRYTTAPQRVFPLDYTTHHPHNTPQHCNPQHPTAPVEHNTA